MTHNDNRTTMLQIPLVEEKYGRAAAASLIVHGMALLLVMFGARLFPNTVIQLGSGQGGGVGGDDITTVGVVDQFSGGAGMVKPSMVPQPPVLEKEPPKPVDDSKSIALPETLEPPKPKKPAPKKPEPKRKEPASKPAAQPTPPNNVIPTEARPGSGGVASIQSGSGGGVGGGSGISIGTGSGGFGDSYYAAAVEKRISENWMRPPAGIRVEVVYSFYIADNGRIYGITKEKSSGNPTIDMTAQRAINLSNPLSAPPRELRGRKIQFVAQFVHPPDEQP